MRSFCTPINFSADGNNLNQTKSYWIRKSTSLMDTSTPRWHSSTPARRQERRLETTCLLCGFLFKYPVGVVLIIFREGSSFDRFSWGWSLDWGNSQVMGLLCKRSRLFGYMDSRDWGQALTQTPSRSNSLLHLNLSAVWLCFLYSLIILNRLVH